MRRGAAGQTGAGPASDDRHADPMADFEYRRYLGVGLRKRHHQGRGAVDGKRIALVGNGVLMTEKDRSVGQNLGQRGDHVGLALFARDFNG